MNIQDYENENKMSARINKGLGLPQLTGTEKQIQFAENCRRKILKKIHEREYNFTDKRIKEIESQTDAKFWIQIKDFNLCHLTLMNIQEILND